MWVGESVRPWLRNMTYAELRTNRTAELLASEAHRHVYHSLYALSLEQWLVGFAPTQLAVLPMGWALADQRRTVRALADHFPSVQLDATRLTAVEAPVIRPGGASAARGAAVGEGGGGGGDDGEADADADGDHPRIEDDIDPRACAWLRTTFFEPDLRALSERLAIAHAGGLMVGGYEDATADEARIFAALTAGFGEDSCSTTTPARAWARA